jgi:HAD superfamily phosphoserine phosphatase-like hydrolase
MSTAFSFDLDGTVTKQELLPVIATELGLQPEMRTLTELTLNGTISFEESFRLRCAILRSVPISVVQSLVADVPLDDAIISFMKANKDRCFVVTGNLDVWIEPLIRRIGCSAYSSTAIIKGDNLVGPGNVLHKNQPVRELKSRFSKVVAVGESVNDVPMFEVADVGIAFGGVHRPARPLLEISDYVVYDGAALCRLLNTL